MGRKFFRSRIIQTMFLLVAGGLLGMLAVTVIDARDERDRLHDELAQSVEQIETLQRDLADARSEIAVLQTQVNVLVRQLELEGREPVVRQRPRGQSPESQSPEHPARGASRPSDNSPPSTSPPPDSPPSTAPPTSEPPRVPIEPPIEPPLGVFPDVPRTLPSR